MAEDRLHERVPVTPDRHPGGRGSLALDPGSLVDPCVLLRWVDADHGHNKGLLPSRIEGCH